ncbi:hypothetical protein HOY80DRAFT_1087685 [Tuber brumale]|nr:hypothetical protein HOY80DRAFT_1087685 [Tuber brumale]
MSTPIWHGSPMIKQYNKSDSVSDWQQYLHEEVLTHPAWRSYLKIKDFEINPHIPTCVGYWEGGNIQPAANELLGPDTIADLLRLVKNPKVMNSSNRSITTGKGGNVSSEPIKIAYTIHIQFRDDSYSSDNKSTSISDVGKDFKETHLATRKKKSHSVSPITRSQTSTTPSNRDSSGQKSFTLSSKSTSLTANKSGQNSDSDQQSFLSTIALPSFHQTKPVPSTPPRTQITSHSSTFNLNSGTLVPPTSYPQAVRKRSLTLLSPEKVTMQNPRTTKKYRNIVNVSTNSEPNSPDDNGGTTSEDPPSS